MLLKLKACLIGRGEGVFGRWTVDAGEREVESRIPYFIGSCTLDFGSSWPVPCAVRLWLQRYGPFASAETLFQLQGSAWPNRLLIIIVSSRFFPCL